MWRWHLLWSPKFEFKKCSTNVLVNPSNYSDGRDKLIYHRSHKSLISGHFDQWLTSTRKIRNWNLTNCFYYGAFERSFLLDVTNRKWILFWAHVWWWRKIFYVYSIYVMYMYNYIYMFSRWLATIRLHQKVKINFIDVPVYRNGRKYFFKTFREFEFKSRSSWTSYLKYNGAT